MTESCPTDIVEAPIGVVWRLLTNPAKWDTFFDLRILQVIPPGVAAVRQRVLAESGPRFLHLGVSFEFTQVDSANYCLGIDVSFPFGIRVIENLRCTALGAARCRVSYGCEFVFPTGWRGAVARTLMSREIKLGPIDSLARLKAAAERLHRAANPRLADTD